MKNIIICAVSVLFFLATLSGYAFLMVKLNQSIQEIAVAKESVASIGKRSALAKAAETFVLETTLERSDLTRYVIDDKGVVDALDIIEIVAEREKIDVSISSVAVESNKENWKHHELVKVLLNGEGSFASLVAFSSAQRTM